MTKGRSDGRMQGRRPVGRQKKEEGSDGEGRKGREAGTRKGRRGWRSGKIEKQVNPPSPAVSTLDLESFKVQIC